MPERRLNLLLVEDNAADAFLIQEALESRPGAFELAWEQRLSPALERIRGDAPPDVVLLDLGLPDSQGIDTFRRVQEAGPRLPVVVLTASASDELALRTLREGAQDHLVK